MTKIEALMENWSDIAHLSIFVAEDKQPEAIDKVCRTIASHFIDLKSGEASTSSVYGAPANSTLKRLCYRLTCIMITNEHFDLLNKRMERYRADARGRPPSDTNPFKTCLSAIFVEAPDALDPRDKSRFGDELFYAYRHFIKDEDLDRFITFCGTRYDTFNLSISKRLRDLHTEPYFRDGIVLQLGFVDADRLMMGDYDDDVVLEASELHQFLHAKRQREAEEARQNAVARKKKKKQKAKRKKQLKKMAREQQGREDDRNTTD